MTSENIDDEVHKAKIAQQSIKNEIKNILHQRVTSPSQFIEGSETKGHALEVSYIKCLELMHTLLDVPANFTPLVSPEKREKSSRDVTILIEKCNDTIENIDLQLRAIQV